MLNSIGEVTPQALLAEEKSIAENLEIKSIDDALYFPKFVQIETTRVCNAKCPFCAIDVWDKSTPMMSDALFSKIVEEIKGYADWIRWVCIQKAGEPLLDKKIGKRIRSVKDAGIKHVNLSTNASLLSEKKGRELIEAGLDEIMFSIDAIGKEEYEKMRVGLNYETVIQNIQTFFRLRDEMNPKMIIRIRGVSFFNLEKEEERRQLEQWEKFWTPLIGSQDRVYMKRAHDWGNQKSWEGHTQSYGDCFHPCIIPWSTITISAMGIVGLCVQDYDSAMNLGDINTQSIKEVWNSEGWNKIRQLHRTGNRNEQPLCRGCRLYDKQHSLEKENVILRGL